MKIAMMMLVLLGSLGVADALDPAEQAVHDKLVTDLATRDAQIARLHRYILDAAATNDLIQRRLIADLAEASAQVERLRMKCR